MIEHLYTMAEIIFLLYLYILNQGQQILSSHVGLSVNLDETLYTRIILLPVEYRVRHLTFI